MTFNCSEESIKNALENGDHFNKAVRDISRGKCSLLSIRHHIKDIMSITLTILWFNDRRADKNGELVNLFLFCPKIVFHRH